MKNITLTIIVLIIIFFSYSSYKKKDFNQKKIGTSCENIFATNVYSEAQIIENNINNYLITTKDIYGKSSEGGEQVNYTLKNGEMILIKQIFFGEIGKSEISYYFKNNLMFYVKKEDTEYLLPISEDSSYKIKSFEVKDFFLNSNKELCSWYKNKEMQSNSLDAKDLLEYLVSGI